MNHINPLQNNNTSPHHEYIDQKSTIQQVFACSKNLIYGLTSLNLKENIFNHTGLLTEKTLTTAKNFYESITGSVRDQILPGIQSAFQTALNLEAFAIVTNLEPYTPQPIYQGMLFAYASTYTIRTGIEDLKKKKTAIGVSKIFLGTAALMGAAWMVYSTLNPQENTSQQTILQENLKKSPEICIFTSYTTDNPHRLQMSRMVADRQQCYASKRGYDYQAFEENLSPGSEPYWSKIGGMLKYLYREVPTCPNPKWIVWVDDDALFTNHNIRIEEVIADQDRTSNWFEKPPHIIVTKDAFTDLGWTTSLNTGVLFVKNSDESREIMKRLFEMRSDPAYNCLEQKDCLHEQQAFHDLLQRNPMKEVKIIDQRERFGINTFERFSHYDVKRAMNLNYGGDPYINKFHKGDFIAQCTGMAMEGYTIDDPTIRNLRAECLEKLDQKTLSDS